MNHSETIAQYLANGKSAAERNNNFVDWFCADRAIPLRAKDLDAKLKTIIESKQLNIDINNYKCHYKNCCPVIGTLYDIIVLTPINGDEIITVVPKSGHVKSPDGEVNSSTRGVLFKGPWKEIKKWLKSQ